jgi:hypothetical protein
VLTGYAGSAVIFTLKWIVFSSITGFAVGCFCILVIFARVHTSTVRILRIVVPGGAIFAAVDAHTAAAVTRRHVLSSVAITTRTSKSWPNLDKQHQQHQTSCPRQVHVFIQVGVCTIAIWLWEY